MIVKPGDISNRVGLEDNIWYDEERTRLATNRDQVERILVIAKALGRTPYFHKKAREVLGVKYYVSREIFLFETYLG